MLSITSRTCTLGVGLGVGLGLQHKVKQVRSLRSAACNATARAGGKTVPRRGGCLGSPHHKAVPRRSMNAPGLGLGLGLGLRLGLGLGLGLGTYP